MVRWTVFALLVLIGRSEVMGEEIEDLGVVQFQGTLHGASDLSGIADIHDGEFLVIASDETHSVQVLKQIAPNEFAVHTTIHLSESEEELDLEGIAVEEDWVYVIGSHCRTRSRVKPEEESQDKNRERLTRNRLQADREGIFRFRLNQDGELDSEIEASSLRSVIDEHEILQVFSQIPSKENGIDIEGIASHGDHLYAAFRGPVLRDGYVPLLRFEFDKPDKAKTRFVNLQGRGIRDMTRVRDGFLLLGGPMGIAPVSFEVYFWDGKDGIPGDDAPQIAALESLGTVPTESGSNPEGITLLKEDDDSYFVLIVFDNAEGGQPRRFRVKK